MNNYKWDAKEYQNNSRPQQDWARELIAKLDLKGNERVLDIGCGDGKITAEIAQILKEGSVTGVDSSKEMIDLAIENFPGNTYKNLSFIMCDAKKLNFDNEFDIVFSNATFHWIKNHKAALLKIKKSLKKSGKILIQMGGTGNLKDIIEATDIVKATPKWKDYFLDFKFPWSFYGPKRYKSWLDSLEFKIIYLKLINKDIALKGVEELKNWVKTIWIPYTVLLPEDMHNSFMDEIINTYIKKYPLDKDGFAHISMVRLEFMAEK